MHLNPFAIEIQKHQTDLACVLCLIFVDKVHQKEPEKKQIIINTNLLCRSIHYTQIKSNV